MWRSARAALSGQSLAEYALILLFVAMAAVLALGALGTAVAAFYDRAAGAFPGS